VEFAREIDGRREIKKKEREKLRGTSENSTRDDSTTVGRYGPSGRLRVNASSTLETDRNGVRAFRSRFRVPVDPASASLHPCADVAAQNSSLPFVGGRRDRRLASPRVRLSTTQPCNPPSRYIDIQPFHHRHQTLLNIVVSVRALCANVNVFGVSRILVWLRRKYQLFPIISIYRTILCILNIFNIYFIAILERDTLKMSSRDEWNCNNICMCHTSYK